MAHYSLHIHAPVAELDPYEELRPSAVARLLQLAASEASSALGYDAGWYARNNTTWILRRTSLHTEGPIRQGDDLEIRTWVADFRRVRSIRRYEVMRGDELVAAAASDWVFASTSSGAPLTPTDDMQSHFMPEGIATEKRPPRIQFGREDLFRETPIRRVEFADLDSLGHVNNARYIDFAQQTLLNTLASEGWQPDISPQAPHLQLRGLDIEYLKAALYQQQIVGRLGALARTGEAQISATIELVTDDTPSVRAICEWQWCGDPQLPDVLGRIAK